MNSRRQILTQGVSAATALLHSRHRASAAPAKWQTPANWFAKPMRWAQLVFTEDDPGHYNKDFWLDYFRRTHSEGACLAGGGYMAFYPTKVPLHHRSRFLGERDPFGDLVQGCRQLGMYVIARTDPHAAHQALADAHPDWIAVDSEGKPRRHWANPELWVTCGLGPMNFEFMTAVTREIVEMYGVDGIFSNRWSGSGDCYCVHCEKNFRAFSGLALPRSKDPHDPSRRAYLEWREQRLFTLWKLWDGEIRAINPNACFIPNAGGGALSDLDMRTVGEMAPILFADRQARHGVAPPWENGKNGKEYRAGMGMKPIGGIFSVGIEEPYRWKDSVQDPAEIRLWVADGIAGGLRPWFTKFNAKPYDKRWMEPVAELYDWHYKNQRYLRNVRNLARVGVVFSQQTARYYGGETARAKVEDHINGIYQALVEARIPFEMVHDRKLNAEALAGFRTLVLPNIACLSDAQCQQLSEYVARGGSIVATHETSLYDEWGNPRKDFGLAAPFGATFAGKVEPRMQNSYLRLRPPHPLLRGLEGTSRIINGVARVHTRSTQPSPAPLTVIPSYPDLPMEDVYPRKGESDIPGVHLRENGSSRVVYFPWDIDRTFWEVLASDHLKLLSNAVLWANNEEPVVTVTGAGVLDLAVWQQEGSLTVHLVNLTNPMMMKGPARETIPLTEQRVRVKMPENQRPQAVRLLVAGERAAFRPSGRYLEVQVPKIGLHEVVAIDLA